jgi:hypothetical protein
MRLNTKAIFGLLTFPLLLAGCGQMSPSFDDMSRTYQTVIEKYDRNGLFLNIVRSSKKVPLSFLTIPSITGSGSIAENAGVSATVVSTLPGTAGGFFSAGTGTYYAPSLGVSLSRGFTFTQSSLDNAAFFKSFMSEIPLAAIDAFGKSTDDKRELVYNLIIDSLLIVSPDGTRQRLRNTPEDETYDAFQSELHKLIELGLTTELLDGREALGPPLSAEQVNDILFKYLDAKDDKRLSMEEVVSKDGKKKQFQIYQSSKTARFCFSQGPLANQVKEQYSADLLCNDVLDTSNDSSPVLSEQSSNGKKYIQLGFKVRSTGGVFNFLGNVVKLQTQPNPKIITVLGDKDPSNPVNTPGKKNIPLFVVYKNTAPKGKIFAEIEYEGDVYYIPSEGSGYSTQVMGTLFGFVSLNKVPGSIPNSPAVLIK